MARIKVCGVCWKPVSECICEDGEEIAVGIEGLEGDDEDAA